MVLIGAQLVLVALPAITLAWLLRRAGVPGGRASAAILAGIVVSLLAGPAVLGRTHPDLVVAKDANRHIGDNERSGQVGEVVELVKLQFHNRNIRALA